MKLFLIFLGLVPLTALIVLLWVDYLVDRDEDGK